MGNVIAWTLNEYVVVGVLLGVFGLVGFRRGVNRELLSIIGVAVAMLVSAQMAPTLAKQVNLLYRLARLALGGGFGSGNPAQAWQQLNQMPGLIQIPQDLERVGLLTFVGVLAVFYSTGQSRIAAPDSTMLRVLGLLAGAINGFLVAYYLLPIVLPKTVTVIALPTGQVHATLSSARTVAWVLALFVLVLIALGLHSASGAKKR